MWRMENRLWRMENIFGEWRLSLLSRFTSLILSKMSRTDFGEWRIDFENGEYIMENGEYILENGE